MSFGTYARRACDRDLPYGVRYCALRCAVSRYHPLGFNATWSLLSTAGTLRRDEPALMHALEMIERSRNAWLAEMSAFADRRRAQKRQHRRTPSSAEMRYLRGWRWPGPDGHQAMFREIGLLWAEHAKGPFPESPPSDKGYFVELDSTLAGCVSTYLHNGGMAGQGHKDILLRCLPELRRSLGKLGYPPAFPEAVSHMRRLLKMTELVVNDAFPVVSELAVPNIGSPGAAC